MTKNSFNPENLKGGIGAVIRDDRGRFIAACNDPVHYAIDANTLEAMAVRRGLALANEVGCPKIIVQSDCLQVIETLQSGCFSSMAAAALFEDIIVQASTSSKCDFSFCNREANSVVDCLARETGTLPLVWVDEPPDFITALLIDDVTII
uniref:Uncharacterized protein n=1 Tax=Avena sativa TaxID=4498 RepID=A0ACD6ATS5_AVESA